MFAKDQRAAWLRLENAASEDLQGEPRAVLTPVAVMLAAICEGRVAVVGRMMVAETAAEAKLARRVSRGAISHSSR